MGHGETALFMNNIYILLFLDTVFKNVFGDGFCDVKLLALHVKFQKNYAKMSTPTFNEVII